MRRGNPPTELEARFLDLIERNRGRIGRLCQVYAESPADRDDLYSEVCFQLWRSLPSFDRRASEDTWLYRVALNTALLYRRRERSRGLAAQAFERQPRTVAAGGEALRLEERERLNLLHAAIRRLAAGERALLTLYLEELPYRRIAEITGLSENHVGVKLNRVRKKLARLLDGGER